MKAMFFSLLLAAAVVSAQHCDQAGLDNCIAHAGGNACYAKHHCKKPLPGVFSRIANIFTGGGGSSVTVPYAADTSTASRGGLIFCDKVSPEFVTKVKQVCAHLEISNCNWLMAAMAFETGTTFSPSVQNPVSHATGLIQFMDFTAKNLGTSLSALKGMTAVQQLDYVQKYFQPYKGKLTSLESVYMAILWPAAVGQGANYALFNSPSNEYKQNKGLDVNGDGKVTAAEAASKVTERLNAGLAANPACLASGSSGASSTSASTVHADDSRPATNDLRSCLCFGGGAACFSEFGAAIPAPCVGKTGWGMLACVAAVPAYASYQDCRHTTEHPVTTSSTASVSTSGSSDSSIPSRIYQAASALKGASSRSGPDGGNLACAYMVNKAIKNAGLATIGANTNFVPSVEDALKGGRGKLVTAASSLKGDIVISPGQAHIGICMVDGCTSVLSNSSSQRSFSWTSNLNFSGFYGRGTSKIYRVTS